MRFAVAQSPAASASNALDAQWFVTLVCQDVQRQGVPDKGYTFRFPAEVKAGHLNGQLGVPDTPSSLKMVLVVQADGTAELTASGYTGNPDYTVGAVSIGTPYSYRLRKIYGYV